MTNREIKSSDFLRLLHTNDLKSESYCNIVIDQMEINSSSTLHEFNKIKNVVFTKTVLIKNVDIQTGFHFYGCEFKNGITLVDVETTGYRPLYISDILEGDNLLFSDCKVSSLHIGTNCNFERAVTIKDSSEVGKISIHNSKIGTGGFSINNSTINDYLEINSTKSSIKLNNSTFKKGLTIRDTSGDIRFVKSLISGSVRMFQIKCPFGLTFNYNKFESTVDIDSSIISGLYIHGDNFKKKFKLDNRDLTSSNIQTNLNEIYITEASFIEGCELDGMGKEIKKITIPFSPKLQGVLRIINWKANEVKISGVNQYMKLLFKQIFFTHLSFIDFSNYSDLGFDRCKAMNQDNSLFFFDCDLGSTRFNDFSFNSFDIIRVNNVSLNNIVTSNIDWFKDEKLSIDNIVLLKDKNRGKREIYRQLKHSLRKNGNQIDSLIFQARELKAFRNELKATKKYRLTDRVNMTTLMTNNYGLSWWKPLWIVSLITFAFYLIMLPLFSGKIEYACRLNFAGCTIIRDEIINNFEVVWQMFNPVRKFSSVYNDANGGWLHFFDLLHRVILAIFIFQIIKGFRKYVSK